MKKHPWIRRFEKYVESFFQNQFNYFLLLIIFILFSAPFVRFPHGSPVIPLWLAFLSIALNVLILRIMISRPRLLMIAIAAFLIIFLFDLIVRRLDVKWGEPFIIGVDMVYVFFLGFFLSHLLQVLFNQKKQLSIASKTASVFIFFDEDFGGA